MRLLTLIPLIALTACIGADDAGDRWPQVEAQAGLAACTPEPPELTAALETDPTSAREALRTWHRADPAAVTRQVEFFLWFRAFYCEGCPPIAAEDAELLVHVAASMARCGGHVERAVADALVFTAFDLDPTAVRATGAADPERYAAAWDIPGTVARDAVELWTVAQGEGAGARTMAGLQAYLAACALDTPRGIPELTTSRYLDPLAHVVHASAAQLFVDAQRRDIARDRCLFGTGAVARPEAVGVLLATDDPDVGMLRVPADGVLGVPDHEDGVPYLAPVDVGDLGRWWALDTQGVIGPVSAPAATVRTTCENDRGIQDWVEAPVSLRLLGRRPEPETTARVIGFVVPYPLAPWPVSPGARLRFEPRTGSPISAAIEERAAEDCDGPDPEGGVALVVNRERLDLCCCGP